MELHSWSDHDASSSNVHLKISWPLSLESPTWNNTVASVLSVQNHIFLSGVETKGTSGKISSVV